VQLGYETKTGPGCVNNSGRANGNGPRDECSRRIVEWVHGFSESDLTDSCIETIKYLQNDTLGSLYGGFESEPARINARLSQTMPGLCTVMGYGLKTTYEMAVFTNAAMSFTRPVRRCQRITVSGVTMMRVCFHPDQDRLTTDAVAQAQRVAAGARSFPK
jgi:hypothetical protein